MENYMPDDKKMFDDQKLYSVADLIRIMGYCRMTVWRHEKMGLRRATKRNHCVRYSGTELNRFYAGDALTG